MKGAHAVRPPSSTGKNVEQRDAENNKEEGTHPRSAMIAETLAAAIRQGRGLPDPPKPSPLFSPDQRRSACRLLFSKPPKHTSAFSLAPMSNSSSSSHARWQGAVRWKQGWSSAWKGWDDSSATASPAQNPEQGSDERVTNALQTTVISPQALTLNAFRASCIKDAMEAATQAREQQEEAGLAHDQKCQDAAEAETILNDAIKNTLCEN